jgi:SagB-type dehydrogenase family enzyme
MIPVDDPVSLSRLYHLNSEPWLNEQAYRQTPFLHEYMDHPGATLRVDLPTPCGGALASLFASRQSTRAFAAGTMALATLSDLLFAAHGVVDIAPLETGGAYLRRSVPSAGALYPLEIFLLLRDVENLEDGIYGFDPRSHALDRLFSRARLEEALDAFYTLPFLAGANAIVCHAAVFGRCQKKYGPRGYRYILLEAGHSAQNLCLAAQERGLATLCMGGFRDSTLNRCLGLREPGEGVVYSVAVGRPAPAPAPAVVNAARA